MKHTAALLACFLLASCTERQKEDIRETVWSTELGPVGLPLNEFQAAKDACEEKLPRNQECVFTYQFVAPSEPVAPLETKCVPKDPGWPCTEPSSEVLP